MFDALEATGSSDERTAPPGRPNARRTSCRKSESIRTRGGLTVERKLTRPSVHPFDEIEWEERTATIADDKGRIIFQQEKVEVPKSWSMLATNVVASKYLYGPMGTDEREHSVRQLVHRVARTIADWGRDAGYFATPDDAEIFYHELAAICVNQYGAFNSPVWFNVGLYHVYGRSSDSRSSYTWDEAQGQVVLTTDCYKHPQASACFILSVDDTMEDIMRLASTEAILFKYGSGTGTDLSTLRSTKEKLSGGGTPSGPLSFMRVFDQVAAVIKSGGKTRRAAKMQSLKVRHPDILAFIECKVKEEKKARALIAQGYDGSFGGEAYESVMYQNSNLAVRVDDEFMQAVESDGTFETLAVRTGEPVETLKAREVLHRIAEATHFCGDPGLQYDTTINRWNTCLTSGRINASNPCSEFMFLDNSACNLASVNLLRFVDAEGNFDVQLFCHVVRLLIVAQEILVDRSSYPTREIAANSHGFRPLGLGYANLGALLMRLGLPYDSDAGRAYAAAVTALMTAQAYRTSEKLAAAKGPFEEFEKNRDCMLRVLHMHRDALEQVDPTLAPQEVLEIARELWDQVVAEGPHGIRNAQVTLLAPTGTIGFMMDCDTTGIEPDIALVKYKQLAGGGMMKIVNRTVPAALEKLGYTKEQVEAILAYLEEKETIEDAPGLKAEHLPVFDCAYRPKNGTHFIPYKAHIRMMAAVQPFLSGAISKTVNMPNDATVEDIMQTYVEGWKLGLKALAIYRDGSKAVQPLSTSRSPAAAEQHRTAQVSPLQPYRRRMPTTRRSITHKFEIAGHEGYLTVGMYEDGSPGELFITMAKEGSTVGGMMDAFGTAISLCLQYGVPLEVLCNKFAHSHFEPSGFTKNQDIPIAKSIVDYIFRWLQLTFPGGKISPPETSPAPGNGENTVVPSPAPNRVDLQFLHFSTDAPVCDRCGAITVRNGSCYRCYNCGNSMGCS